MDVLGLSRSLKELVEDKFEVANESQSLTFSETKVALLEPEDAPQILLRYCPTLDKKPQNKGSMSNGPHKRVDPFASPSPELLITPVATHNPTHNLVLNKFPVIRRHFILATIADKPQTGLLEPNDLAIAYACLRAWELGNDSALYAFFNSGEHSGASQPHRHIQFLPVEDMAAAGTWSRWHMLHNTMTTPRSSDSQLCFDEHFPVMHFATRLNQEMTADDLHERYLLLLGAVSASLSDGSNIVSASTSELTENGQVMFSYNLSITSQTMAILPRRRESSRLPNSDSLVAVNGTILAGTTMVKSEVDWQGLCKRPGLVRHILSDIAYPRPAQQSNLRL